MSDNRFKWESMEGSIRSDFTLPLHRYTDDTTKRVEGYVTGGHRGEWTAYNGGTMVDEEVCGVYVDLEAAKKRVEQLVKQRLEGEQ